eukprot:7826921-Lingulodinium_polyedra.AAC.1
MVCPSRPVSPRSRVSRGGQPPRRQPSQSPRPRCRPLQPRRRLRPRSRLRAAGRRSTVATGRPA